MTLGTFLLVIFLLWLIDKHNLWPKALKAVLILVVIGAFGLAGIWVRNERIANRLKAEQETEQQAAEVARRTKLTDCIKRMTQAFQYVPLSDGSYAKFKAGVSKDEMRAKLKAKNLTPLAPKQHPEYTSDSTLQVDAQSTCEQDPDASPTSPEPKWYKMQASDGKWYKTLATSSQEARNKIEGPVPRPQQHRGLHHLLARLDADLHTTEFGSLVCAHVTRGETVTLLQDDSLWVKVKTQSGKTGWGDSEHFEVMD